MELHVIYTTCFIMECETQETTPTFPSHCLHFFSLKIESNNTLSLSLPLFFFFFFLKSLLQYFIYLSLLFSQSHKPKKEGREARKKQVFTLSYAVSFPVLGLSFSLNITLPKVEYIIRFPCYFQLFLQ
jgi:hypothetical protein